MEEVKAVILVFLFVCSIWDLRKREIPVWFCIVGAILVLGIQMFKADMALGEMTAGIMIGISLLIISKITAQIGAGDGIVFIITGLGLGFWNNFWLLWEGLLLMAAVSLLLLLFQKINWKSKLPFLPFVLGAYIIGFVKDMG